MNSKKEPRERKKKKVGATEMREKAQERSELEEHLNWKEKSVGRHPSALTETAEPTPEEPRNNRANVKPNGTEPIGKKSERIENCSVVLLVEWVPL